MLQSLSSRFTLFYCLVLIIEISSLLFHSIKRFQSSSSIDRRTVVGGVLSSFSNDSVEDHDNNLFVGATYRSKTMRQRKGDNRDFLPFSVCREGSKSELGTYLLEPSTSCGDFLDLGNLGIFKVKKVAFLYKFQSGSFVVYKKKLEVLESSAPWKGDEVIAAVEDSNVLQ